MFFNFTPNSIITHWINYEKIGNLNSASISRAKCMFQFHGELNIVSWYRCILPSQPGCWTAVWPCTCSHCDLVMFTSLTSPSGQASSSDHLIHLLCDVCSMSVSLMCATRYTDPLLVQCWASVADDGPTLNQHWAGVSCLRACHTLAISLNDRYVCKPIYWCK